MGVAPRDGSPRGRLSPRDSKTAVSEAAFPAMGVLSEISFSARARKSIVFKVEEPESAEGANATGVAMSKGFELRVVDPLRMELCPWFLDAVCPSIAPAPGAEMPWKREVSLPETPEGAVAFVIATEGKIE
jgi:hypothetical protein